MHGSELGEAENPPFFRLLPAVSFGGNGLALPNLTATLRPGFPLGSDLSLAHNDCSFPSHHCKVDVPGLPLRRLTEASSNPFGLPLPRLVRGAINEANPLFSSVSVTSTAPPTPLPLRVIKPVKIKAFARFAAVKPAFRDWCLPFAPFG